ncbi:hypothetical protein BDZ89DRAFT_1059421, partial [Hymenopellis radicata]
MVIGSVLSRSQPTSWASSGHLPAPLGLRKLAASTSSSCSPSLDLPVATRTARIRHRDGVHGVDNREIARKHFAKVPVSSASRHLGPSAHSNEDHHRIVRASG